MGELNTIRPIRFVDRPGTWRKALGVVTEGQFHSLGIHKGPLVWGNLGSPLPFLNILCYLYFRTSVVSKDVPHLNQLVEVCFDGKKTQIHWGNLDKINSGLQP